MRIANHAGRLALVEPDAESPGGLRGLDVERASGGRFAADPQAVYGRWDEFRAWAASADLAAAVVLLLQRPGDGAFNASDLLVDQADLLAGLAA